MRALVTGANGLIGSNIVRALLREGHRVRAFVRAASDLTTLAGLPIEVAHGDVLDRKSLSAAAGKCDVVFHCAARFAYGSDLAQLDTLATQGTANVLRAARRRFVRRAVLTSSSVIFGFESGPRSRNEADGLASDEGEQPYVTSKIRQEKAARLEAARLGIDLISVCPTVSVGPAAPNLGPSNGFIVTYIADPFRMTYPGGCNIVSARDVGHAHVLAACRGKPGASYVVGSENLEWEAIHRILSELCGIDGPRIRASHTACLAAAAGEEARARVLGRPALTTREQARMVGRYYWYDHGRIGRLGYRPEPARRALAGAVSWLTSSRHISRELRAQMTLGPEVYEARREATEEEAELKALA